jgi:hypothetical protein
MPLSIRPAAASPAAHVAPDTAAPGWWSGSLPPTTEQLHRAAAVLWCFNCQIAGMAHPTWIDQPAALRQHPAYSAHLLACHGLAGCHDWHCHAAVERLWLMDGASISDVLLGLGGVAQAPRLRRLLRGADRAAVRATWPEASWRAAHDALAPQIALPLSVLGEPPKDDAEQAAEALARLGAQLLRGALSPDARAVAGRARLRLPKAWADDMPLGLPAETQQALTAWISAVWIPQRSPAWAWLF